MMEASARLPSHIARGAIQGVKGTYGATIINGKPSRTSEWRSRKQHKIAAELRDNREEAYQKDHTKKSMLTHFFYPRNDSIDNINEDNVVQQNLSDAWESDSESIAGESELDEILNNDPTEPRPASSFLARPFVPDRLCLAPNMEQASNAIPILLGIMRTRRGTAGRWENIKVDLLTLMRLKSMLSLFRLYTEDPVLKGQWKMASETVARSEGKNTTKYGERIRKFCQDFIVDHTKLPRSMYGTWTTSALHADEDLKQEITTHLQSVGRLFSSDDVLNFINQPSILERLGRQKKMSRRTAQRWLKILGFRWRMEEKGMYTDGHEREDVVQYRQQKFLPRYHELNQRARQYDGDGNEVPQEWLPLSNEKEVIFHHHDESTFYGNDRRKLRWVHNSESPKPYAKGEGQSVMVADFVSSRLGWLSSPDGSKRARVSLRPGKARDGYFSCDEVLGQLTTAMDILDEHYPSVQHVFILDNARTHTKRAEDSLSARHMPKEPRPSFGVNSVVRGSDGKIVYDQSGKPLARKQRMENARFANGTSQSLYYPSDHPQYPDHFKGMSQILRERGFSAPEKIRAECKGFKCNPNSENCCQRRILFNQPDFANVPSLVESHCQARGYIVIFLPKFHPELNFIEMCWGFGKRVYRELPPSSKIDDIEEKALWSLDQIPLTTIRR